MERKVVTGIMLTLLLVGALTWVFDSSSASYQPPATQWNKTYGGTGTDFAYSVVQTGDGGYALAGETRSYGAGFADFWLVKTDSSGNMQWNKTYGGTGTDVAYSVVQTGDGGYALAGQTDSYGGGGMNFWLVKTDSSGNMQWNKTYVGTGLDEAYSMVQTGDGGYALAGDTTSYGPGDRDFWLVKTDSSGNIQWNKTYGGASSDLASSVVQTGDGGYALAGYTDFYTIPGLADFWLVKTDSSGNMQWNKTYGGAGSDVAQSVVQTGDGGYALAGYTRSYGAGSYNFWLVKTDSSGNIQWNKTYVGAAFDVASSVVQTGDGGYALAGQTDSYGAGISDFRLVKTDSSGNMQWNKTYGGAGTDVASSMVQTGDGGYALAGGTDSYGAGSYDFWLIKLAPEVVIVTVGGETVLIEGNVTLTSVRATRNTLHFWASGLTGQTGYINVTFPVGLNTTEIKVFVDGQKLTPPPFPIITTNGTHYFIYFQFTLSTHEITMEFAPPSAPVGGIWIPVDKLALLAPYIGLASTILIATVATAIYIKHRKKKQ